MSRRSIIGIVTDEQRFDTLGCYGSPVARPRISAAISSISRRSLNNP